MKYSLRSLMIVVFFAPALLAAGWFGWHRLQLEEISPYHVPDTGLTVLDGPPPYFEPPNPSAPVRNPPKE